MRPLLQEQYWSVPVLLQLLPPPTESPDVVTVSTWGRGGSLLLNLHEKLKLVLSLLEVISGVESALAETADRANILLAATDISTP